MAASPVPTSLILLGLALLYVVLNYPVGYVILTVSVAIVAFLMNKNIATALGVVIVMIVIRSLGDLLTPKPSRIARPYAEGFQGHTMPTNLKVAKEGFQAKDPISIHQRIAKERREIARVPSVTGVLESPEILDSLHVGQVRPEEEGFTNSVQPAGVTTTQPIPTPAESSMPARPTADAAPMANPYLQNGPDLTGVQTALAAKGTALATSSASTLPATTTGAAPYS